MRSWIVGLVVAAALCCGAAGHLRHAVQHHRKLRSDRSVDATYLVQFLGIDSMRRFHAERRHDVHVTAWYPQFQAAAVAQVSEDVLWELLNDPSVAYMEADEWVYGSSAVSSEVAQLPNHAVLAPKEATTTTTPAYYTGAGVRVYVLDSGIQSDHDEFSATNVQCQQSSACEDPWGHGTHVAALIAGRTFGVAPDVELIAMPVLGADTKARFSQVLAALDHVVVAEQQRAQGSSRAIVNLSLGTPRVATILNEAVQRTVEAGIPVIVAAGNGATDACNWSPASAMGSIAVGALDRNGIRYKASNYGPCVDLYAPGELITSAWKDNTLNTITGTSSASPFITGIAALYLERDPSLTPAELLDLLEDHHAMTVIPDALLSQPVDTTSSVSNNNSSTTAITDFILDEDVLAAARTFIENASSVSSDAPTAAPTATPVDWFEQIRETVQLRFWNNGGE